MREEFNTPDPFRWVGTNSLPLRLIYGWAQRRFGFGYVTLPRIEGHLWALAARHAPIQFRWFGRSLCLEEIDAEFNNFDEWTENRST